MYFFVIIGHLSESNFMMKHTEFYCAIANCSLREKYEFLEFQREYTQIFQNVSKTKYIGHA